MARLDDFANRFVRLRCPLCDQTSPTCDQATDIRRGLLFDWWAKHRATHLPRPIVERAEPPPPPTSSEAA